MKILMVMIAAFSLSALSASVIEIKPDDTVIVAPDGCVARSAEGRK